MFVIVPFLIVLFLCDRFSQFISCYSNQVQVYKCQLGTSPLGIMFTFWFPPFTLSLHLILVGCLHICNISIFNCSVFMWLFLPVYLLLFKSSTGTCYSNQVYVGLIGTSPLSIMFTFLISCIDIVSSSYSSRLSSCL